MRYEALLAINPRLVKLRCHGLRLKAHNIDSIWHLCKARNEHSCVIGGPYIRKGDTCWRPITFGGNRYHRISTAGMAQLVHTLYEKVGLAARGQSTRVEGG